MNLTSESAAPPGNGVLSAVPKRYVPSYCQCRAQGKNRKGAMKDTI